MRKKELAGIRFGKLLVTEEAIHKTLTNGKKNKFYKCVCDCGNELWVGYGNLTSGKTKSCGCLRSVKRQQYHDITGQRFNRLVAVSYDTDTKKWLCQCDCGNICHVGLQPLRKKLSQSCGCLWQERVRHDSGMSSANMVYAGYRHKANKRGLSFEISLEDAIEVFKKDCNYCGIYPYQVCKQDDLYGDFTYNGIDRIDSSVGYTIDNILPCCGICNKAKWTSSYDDFMRWMKRVYENVDKPKSISIEPIEMKFVSESYRQYKSNSKKSNIEFDIDKEQYALLINSICWYCGTSPSMVARTLTTQETSLRNGLDKVDSSLGYTSSNVVPCCWQCNCAKKNMSLMQFKDWINRFSKHQGFLKEYD